jgi:hypothetical protein
VAAAYSRLTAIWVNGGGRLIRRQLGKFRRFCMGFSFGSWSLMFLIAAFGKVGEEPAYQPDQQFDLRITNKVSIGRGDLSATL